MRSKQHTSTSSPRRLGSTLILVIGSLALMAVIISTFLTVARLNTYAATSRQNSVRLDLLANTVLGNVRLLIARDLEIDQEPCDHPRFDPWLASLLTDNEGFGTTYRYITRLDLADNQWNNGAGARAGGRLPTFSGQPDSNFQREIVGLASFATAGVYLDGNRDGVVDNGAGAIAKYYVDADGDGRADSLLMPIGTTLAGGTPGTVFPDGSMAYVAVRVVDNAHLNPNQHHKWAPKLGDTGSYPPPAGMRFWTDNFVDSTDGRIDWTYLPEPGTLPAQLQFRQRPRLPHVSFENLRNLAMLMFPSVVDDPDGQASWSALDSWFFNVAPDRMTMSDSLYIPYMPGIPTAYSTTNPLMSTFAPLEMAGLGLSKPGMIIPGNPAPTNASADLISARNPTFTIDDELAIRAFSINPAISKYAQVYRQAYGTRLGGLDPNNLPVNFQNNYMRMTSSCTRERTQQWFQPGNGGVRAAQPVLTTPFDLKKLLTSDNGDFNTASGGPNATLLNKLGLLGQYLTAYGVFPNQGINYDGSINVPQATRRAQFLANLAEYNRKRPANAGTVRTVRYTPTEYNIPGLPRVIGFCRQPVFTEFIRDGGAMPTGGLTTGARRNFSNVRMGIELYNPFDTALDLTDYIVEIEPVAFGAVTRTLQPTLRLPLAPAQRIPPYGYLWISTHADPTMPFTGSEVPTQHLINSNCQLALDAATRTAMQEMGPRVVVRLKSRLNTEVANPPLATGYTVLLDIIDTRRTGGRPYTAGFTMNEGLSALGWWTFAVDWRDWDGLNGFGQTILNAELTGDPTLDAAALTRLTATANNGWVNPNAEPTIWQARRSGIYRGMGSSQSITWGYPATSTNATFVNLWHGYDANQTSSTDLVANRWYLANLDLLPIFMGADPGPRPSTPGSRNSFHDPVTNYTAPLRYFSNPINPVLGIPVVLPNRGWEPLMGGTRFFNLGELGLVLTVGNNENGCVTQAFAAASEIGRTDTYGPNQSVTPTTPGAIRPANRWGWVNAERLVKFDLYEGCSYDPALGMPFQNTAGSAGNNARILDFVSLYMGNGLATSATEGDFAPYPGPVDDTSLEYRPELPILPAPTPARAGYREGRINVNTAPTYVMRCIPTPRVSRQLVNLTNGAVSGESVRLADAFSSSNSNNPGYMNRVLPTGLDPYFARTSDIYQWAQATQVTNPTFISNSWNGAGMTGVAGSGLGWDMRMNSLSLDTVAYIMADSVSTAPAFRWDPHQGGYQYPQLGFKNGEDYNWLSSEPGSPFTFNMHEDEWGPGLYTGMQRRDSIWALTTNTLSTRSDVFTVYIVVKLLRPNPLASGTGQEFEDLGEVRLIAIIDRTNVRLITDPTNYGRIVPGEANLPRVLGKMMLESN